MVLGADNLIGLPKVNLLKRETIVVIICKFRARKVPGTSFAPEQHQFVNDNVYFCIVKREYGEYNSQKLEMRFIMNSSKISIIFLLAILNFVNCTDKGDISDYGLLDTTGDVGYSDTLIEDTPLIQTKTIKLSIRNNFIDKEPNEEAYIIIYRDSDSLLPDDAHINKTEKWETDKTITISLNTGENILAFIDKDNDSKLSQSDYFGILRADKLMDGGRYILLINSYIPFERNEEQGLNGNEISVFERIKDRLRDATGLSMVLTRINEKYFIYSKIGTISFKRIFDGGVYKYPIEVIEGKNPIENTDETALSTYEEEIEAGSNPLNTQYQGAGYEVNDRRISFVESENTFYPYAYERIAQLFDNPNAGDIIGLPEPYGDGLYEIGSHGHLDITQSRAPIIFSGKGVNKGRIYEKPAKAVDIAPTLIAAIGGNRVIGVNKYNQLSVENYLRRQDGDVISEILDNEIPEYAIIIVSDGLSHTELERALRDENYNIPNLKKLKEDGVYFKYGHITNYFSVTIPSHTTIGTGVYAGHHGIVNNLYYLRDRGRLLTLIDLGVGPAQYLVPEIETIFEAYHRNFGKYDGKYNKTGKFSASINQPCTRGATYATLESLVYNFASYSYEPLPIIEELKQVTSADNTAVNQMIYLFEKGELPIPNLIMINLTSTDSAGHGWGPHSDMIKRVLEQTDFRIGKIIQLYKNAGIFDKTLFIFTADHGMEIQDKNRSFEYKIDGTDVTVPVLDEANVKYVGGLPFIYLVTLDYKVDREFLVGEYDYEFYVFDEDRGFPLKTASVRVSQDENSYECITDENGRCKLKIELRSGTATLRIEHNSYNYLEKAIEIK